MPSASTFGTVRAPSPASLRIGSGSSRAPISSGFTITRPSGLRRSEAILATSLFGATPTDAVSPARSRMRRLISRAMCSASPRAPVLAVTSRNASSSDRPCTSGVNSWNTAKICSDTAA